jgi:hypothetical protein
MIFMESVHSVPAELGRTHRRLGLRLPRLAAATGVTIATLYAVLMLTAVAPGAGLLLGDAVRRRRDQGQRGEFRRPDPAQQLLEVVRD